MRIKNIFRNSFFSLLSQLVLLILGFFSQRAMNLYMGTELVGMNGVISNVIAMLSVTELGMCTAIIYHLYWAIAGDDRKEIASLMNLYRKAYHIFAVIITVLGIVLFPFIHLFMKNELYSVTYIRELYGLWLLRTTLSYLLSYKKSLLIASQKEYVVSIVTLLMNTLNYSAVIFLVSFTRKYLLALTLNILVDAGLNLFLSWYVDKKFPYLKTYRRIKTKKTMVEKIAGDLKNIFISKLSTNLLNCTDNLLISGFINVTAAGLYANYSLITQNVTNFLVILSESIQPTIGNLFTEKNYEADYRVLRQLTFLFFFCVSVGASGLYSLITPFVTDFWLTGAYKLERITVLFCITVCILRCMGLPLMIVMGVTGLFVQERNLAIVTTVVNLGVSLLLVKPMGTVGVLLGTCLAFAIQIIYRIVVFFRDYVKRSSRRYVFDFLEYGSLIVLEMLGVQEIIHTVYRRGNVLLFICSVFLCCLLPGAVNLLLYCKSWRLRSLLRLLKRR